MVPDSAPVGPTILKLLPPKKAATRPAQIAVIIPAVGDAFEATANDIESGIETSATLSPAFQLSFKADMCMIIYVPWKNVPIYFTVGQMSYVCNRDTFLMGGATLDFL
jgi:hypothetical protein